LGFSLNKKNNQIHNSDKRSNTMKSKTSSIVAFLALVATVPPAYAQYYGQSGYTTNAQVSVLPADQSVQIRNNFNKRFEEIRAQIRTAVSKGQLSQADNANLSNSINQQAAQMESSYSSDGGFTNEESASMVTNLTNLANQVTSTINAAGTGTYAGRLGLSADNGYGMGRRHGGHGYGNGRGGEWGGDANPAVTTAINSRISTLQTQLSTLSQTHQLRRRQVDDISRSLNDTISKRDQAMHHGINDSKAAEINASLDHVATQIQIATNTNASRGNNWDNRSWNDQRTQLRQDWKDRHNHLSAVQQQQLDAQLKAQWVEYHHNSWQGQTSWDQYSDPQFLDYLHTKNPSLLTTIRNAFGI
jgi:hypothetical protein